MPATDAAVVASETPNPLLPAPYDITWSLVVFGIVLFLFWRYVLPKYLSVLDERTERIEGGIKRAELVQEEARELREQYEAQLAAAREEAGRTREEARAEGAAIREEIRVQAEEEARRMVEAARRQIEAERQQAADDLRRDVGRLALDLTERLVGEAMTDDARQQRLVDRFLDEIETSGVAGAGSPSATSRVSGSGSP